MTERHQQPTLEPEHLAFIGHSSLLFIMTGSADAPPDVSPRGDAEGFVKVTGEGRLRLPDRIGNNRIDSMHNILKDRRIAVVFICTGDDRMLAVRGEATILKDKSVLSEFEYKGRLPRSVMEISVRHACLSTSPAFEAADFWRPDDIGAAFATSLVEILSDQVGGMDKTEGEAFIANSYANKLY